MVRLDFTLPNRQVLDSNISFNERSLLTIKYLYHAGAKVLVSSSWGCPKDTTQPPSAEIVADYLSSVLELKVMPTSWISDCAQSKEEDFDRADVLLIENLSTFREELANSSAFARKLSSGVDVFVNDTFSQSHKILASTVGVTRYCYASVAGFAFEEELSRLVEITTTTKQPYIAIIGGDNLKGKAAAIHFLASKCDGLVFVGMIAFQIMHGKGLPVPLRFVESGAVKDSLKIIDDAQRRKIPILLPKDFVCVNDSLPKQLHTFPAQRILDGWKPVDLGPNSMIDISSMLSKCQKILCIGPLKLKLPRADNCLASKLAAMLETSSRSGCDVIVIGTAACKEFSRPSGCTLFKNASVAWVCFKGRVLPGLAALDRAYPFVIDWDTTFNNPAQPLVVDIGSGNGLFIFEMARRKKDMNFLGLEANKKVYISLVLCSLGLSSFLLNFFIVVQLVDLCLDSVHQPGLKNRYFIATNATSTFRSIVSSYPGDLVLVLIQCPNPDFNKPEHRWRMLQRALVEAIVDLLTINGKVFLQSDVEKVAVRMREEFIRYGKNKLAIIENEDDLELDDEGWLRDNPYGVRSDWEQHVINRGAPMYRLMFSRVNES
ncbi:hypothetical protein AQUCO_03000087v1 [Aquilegia coerulea]|uniref:Phosphoglycerate kinase n=1 Tax=Aquilegia coerulea TaxID=218851 RepID=A0A2G5D160_AQUCA|nr:hypothetical protein AQUCO_03000087v1 [Aquilegia coerulea]